MARRGNGEGTIFKAKDGRWVALVDLGYGTGRRRRKALYATTRREVQERLTATLRAQAQGLPIGSDRQTVADFLARWLEVARTSVRPRTWDRYEQYVRVHALPRLGRVPLAGVTPEHLQSLYAARLAAGSAPLTVAHLHAVLHRAFGQAERWGLLPRNPATLVDAPRGPRREMATLTPEQSRALIEASKGDRLGALYVVGITTGMRQGELLALRWRDMDLEGGMAQVRGTMQRTRDGLAAAEPKTERSRRNVALTQTAVAALRRHRAVQLEERLRLGAVWEDNDLVFANEIGAPIEASNLLRRSFRPLLIRADVPSIRFHDLRHTAATLMLGRGVHPKIVSEMLGHAQVATTLDLYSHVTPTMQREAAATLDAVLGG